MESAEWECAICFQLLLDPVVGKCGHDFCRSCLLSWAASSASSGQCVNCPLCRSEVAPNSDSVRKLGVCVRLKRMLESLYPEKVALRRQEKSVEESRTAQAQRAVQLQQVRQGRSRYLRARRTRHVPSQTGSTGALHPSSPAYGFLGSPMPSPMHPVVTTTALGQIHSIPQVVASPPSTIAPVTTTPGAAWQAPVSVVFTMGWWEPPNKDTRRKRAAYRARLGWPGPQQH